MALTTSLSVASKTETSITIKWSANATITTVKYRYKKGSGSYGTWTTKSVSAKTGSFKISSLSVNSSYTIEVDLASASEGTVGTITAKTYNWPYATISNITNLMGRNTVNVVNPLGRTATLVVYAEGQPIWTETSEVESFDFYGSDGWAMDFLETIPNSMTGTWHVEITYSGHTTDSGNKTFSAAGVYNLFVHSYSYRDVNATAQAIIQDDSVILQNISEPNFSITSQGVYGSKVITASVEILGVSTSLWTVGEIGSGVFQGTASPVNSASDVDVAITLTDTRGISTTSHMTLAMTEYSVPSAIITLQRVSNFYTESHITVDGSYTSVGNNALAITYRYKKTTDSTWSNYITLQDNTMATFQADNHYEWNVQVVVTDSFGGTTTYNLTLPIGMPIIFFDRSLRAVGINCFPDTAEQFAVSEIEISLTSAQYTSLANKLGVTI